MSEELKKGKVDEMWELKAARVTTLGLLRGTPSLALFCG